MNLAWTHCPQPAYLTKPKHSADSSFLTAYFIARGTMVVLQYTSASFCEEVGIITHTHINENQGTERPADLLSSCDS